jgi:hypothetical protein
VEGEGETTVVVSSVVECRQKALTYSPTRSHFDAPERADQTVQTIASVREHIPGARIVVVEMGLDADVARGEIAAAADDWIYVGANPLVRRAVDSKRKGLGEAVGLLAAVRHLAPAGYYFKLSGRYRLTSFDAASWSRDRFSFKRYGDDVSTRFYGFPASRFPDWWRALARSVALLALGYSIEAVLPRHLDDRIADVPRLGIAGLTAVEGELLTE